MVPDDWRIRYRLALALALGDEQYDAEAHGGACLQLAYLKATAMGKPVSFNEVAYVRFYRGDWSGGRAALAKGSAAVPTPLLRFDFGRALFWSYMAQHLAGTLGPRSPRTAGRCVEAIDERAA